MLWLCCGSFVGACDDIVVVSKTIQRLFSSVKGFTVLWWCLVFVCCCVVVLLWVCCLWFVVCGGGVVVVWWCCGDVVAVLGIIGSLFVLCNRFRSVVVVLLLFCCGFIVLL